LPSAVTQVSVPVCLGSNLALATVITLLDAVRRERNQRPAPAR
jgi:hypothetical protein